MRRIFLSFICSVFALTTLAQKCDKGCGKITKVEPTNNANIRPDRALLEFKFVGPDARPVKSKVKIIIDKDTIVPVIDAQGTTKMTAKGGQHKIRFKVNWWYTVKMDQVSLKNKNTYHFLVKFEAKDIAGSKPTDDD